MKQVLFITKVFTRLRVSFEWKCRNWLDGTWLNIGNIFGMVKKSSHNNDDDIGSIFYSPFTLWT
jgi:hypothetical protein